MEYRKNFRHSQLMHRTSAISVIRVIIHLFFLSKYDNSNTFKNDKLRSIIDFSLSGISKLKDLRQGMTIAVAETCAHER